MAITIEYSIKFNTGNYQGSTMKINTALSDIEISGLDMCLIEQGYLSHTCNDNEYEVLNRRIINNL